MRDALRLMLQRLDDHAFDEVGHEVARNTKPEPPFQEIPWTTWEDLEARGYIRPKHAMGLQRFFLTGDGWIAVLKVTKQYETDEQETRVIALRRALVDLNKGRPPYGTLTDVPELMAQTALPRGWVTSAVRSQLLRRRFSDDHMELRIEGRVIRIPPRFAADRVEFDPDT